MQIRFQGEDKWYEGYYKNHRLYAIIDGKAVAVSQKKTQVLVSQTGKRIRHLCADETKDLPICKAEIVMKLFEKAAIKPLKTGYEFDDFGNHRISVNGNKSRWEGYSFLSYLTVKGRHFIGASQYYGGTMPTEKLLEILVLEQIP